MAKKGMDFRHKEVINITDGKRLGYVQDVCADLTSGSITSIIVPGSNINSENNVITPNNISADTPSLILDDNDEEETGTDFA